MIASLCGVTLNPLSLSCLINDSLVIFVKSEPFLITLYFSGPSDICQVVLSRTYTGPFPVRLGELLPVERVIML